MAKNRKFEPWELEDAARLDALIKAHLNKLGISQAQFTSDCDWSQGMIYQYTKPERALGLETVTVFANALHVEVDQISPTLANKIRDLYSFVHQKDGYIIRTKEAENAARMVDNMQSQTQRVKAVKITATIAEPEGNGGDTPKHATQ